MNTKKLFIFATSVLTMNLPVAAHADLLGVVQSYPDTTLNQSYLIYDNNAIDANTGLLKVVAFGATLNEGPYGNNSTLTQMYASGTDHTPDLMLSIAIDRNTGNWVNSSNPLANKVTINFGNGVVPNGNGNTPGFKWMGDITNFGWQQEIASTANKEYGTFFDATWKMTEDSYEDMPANMSQFVNNLLTTAMIPYEGGIKISNTTGFGDVAHPVAFQRDWVFGTSATTAGVQALLSPFLSSLSTQTCSQNTSTDCITYVHSTVNADVFVPIPPAFWLWVGALLSIFPSFKSIRLQPDKRS